MPIRPYIAAVTLDDDTDTHVMEFGSPAARAAFLGAVKAMHPTAKTVTTDIAC